MAFYESSDLLYSCTRSLFDRLQRENPAAAESVRRARLLIRFQCSGPAADVLINGRRWPVEISYGENRVRPEVDVRLAADTLHQILLGKLTVPKALATKQMKVTGPAWKTLTLADLFTQTQKIYPEILEEHGLISP